MKALLYFNFSDHTVNTGNGSWTPPTVTFGEALEVASRFRENISGSPAEVSADVRYMKAAIGNTDVRPESSTWCLKIGNAAQSSANTTAPLDWNAGPAAIKAAINALPAIVATYGTVEVIAKSDSLIFRFGTGSVNVLLTLVNDALEPPTVGLTSSWQVAGKWFQKLRLVGAPVAFTDTSARILPAAPSVVEVQEGGSEGDFTWNEIQQMTVAPDFQGTYQFRWNNVRTGLLSISDDADAITKALAIYGSTITATLPRDNVVRFEFSDDFKGLPEPLLEVIVTDAPEGDLTWALTLDTPALATLLETQEEVTLPLEVEFGIGDDSVEGGVRVEKFRTELTIQRSLIFGLLATASGIDWLRPQPTDYVPFMPDQIFRGQLYYAAALGNGTALSFVIDHDLNSDAIASVLLRENIADGRVLVLGVDYVVTYGGLNALTVTLAPGTTPPASAGLMVVITCAGMRDAFLAHTHTIDQIVGLNTILDSVSTRLTTLEAYLPGATPSVADTTATAITIELPTKAEVLFFKGTLPTDLSTLPARAPAMLPAVHDPEVTALPDPLPAPVADTVWSVAARTLIAGGNLIRSSYAPAGGYVASDGRILYPATKGGTTVSYFPTPFERTLWEFSINDKMLRNAHTLEVKCSVAVQLVNATSEAQWVLVIEQGAPTTQTDPENESPNLEDVVWSATPILSQRLMVTPLFTTHNFGCRIKRTADTTLAADRLLYGAWEAATGAAPATANFFLRARLINFDTKNNVPDATGWLAYAFGGDTAKTPGTATIS